MDSQYCYQYTVIWYEQNWKVVAGTPYRKFFSTKLDAKLFARNRRANCPEVIVKPIIVRSIVDVSTFKLKTKVEPVSLTAVARYSNVMSNGETIIRY